MALRLLVLFLLLLVLLLLLRLLFCVLLLYLLFLLLRLPLFCSPEAAIWTPGGAKIDPRGGAKMASWRLWGPPGLQDVPHVAAKPLWSRPWAALEALLAALGAVLGRFWRWRYFWKSAPGG